MGNALLPELSIPFPIVPALIFHQIHIVLIAVRQWLERPSLLSVKRIELTHENLDTESVHQHHIKGDDNAAFSPREQIE